MAKNGRAKIALDISRGVSSSRLRKDPGVPKLIALKQRVRNHDPKHKKIDAENGNDVTMRPAPPSTTIASLAASLDDKITHSMQEESSNRYQRDPTVAAHAYQFRKVLELSDVIIQVLDARDPMGCRSRVVEDEVKKSGGDKMMILVLNKTDLVPKDNVLAWLRYLRHDFPTVPLKSSMSNPRHHHSRSPTSNKSQGAHHLLTLLKSYRRAHISLTVGVVGPPNVGKSSLINALSRLRNENKDVVTVGAKPGQTRDVKEVSLEKGVKILDMPGIVWGDFLGDASEPEGSTSKPPHLGSLSMIGVDSLEDPISAIEGIVAWVPLETLQRLYNIPAYSSPVEFLTMIALSRGCLGKGGTPDQLAAARSILNDWNSGAIPYHTAPPKVHPSSIPSVPRIPEHISVETATSTTDDASLIRSAADVGVAQYVSKFSTPFDLEGLFSLTDKAVLDAAAEDAADEAAPMEGVDADTTNGDLAPDQEEPLMSLLHNNKRAHSPTPSITTTHGAYEPGADGGRVKQPKPKRIRYNPNAPLNFDEMEIQAMASSNPLSRKRQREDAKSKRRNDGDGEAIIHDDDLRLEAALESNRFTFTTSGGAFAALSEADVPLPDDEDEDL